jgi:hypothetical protein
MGCGEGVSSNPDAVLQTIADIHPGVAVAGLSGTTPPHVRSRVAGCIAMSDGPVVGIGEQMTAVSCVALAESVQHRG